MLFAYKISDAKNKITQGTIEAPSRAQARNQLVLKDGALRRYVSSYQKSIHDL